MVLRYGIREISDIWLSYRVTCPVTAFNACSLLHTGDRVFFTSDPTNRTE
jgi:hypothetical protein